MGNAIRNWVAAAGVAGVALSGTAALADGRGNKSPDSEFRRIATFPVYLNTDIANQTGSEIVAASTDGRTLVYTDAALQAAGFIDIGNPGTPRPGGVIPLDGEPTSVAVKGPYALVAVNTSVNFVDVSGYLAVIDIAKREVVAEIDLAGQPDCVAVSPNGLYAAIVIENERD